MSEYADYYNEECEDHELLILDYKMGLMDDQTAYDHGIIDELGFMICTTPKTYTCKYCGKCGFRWDIYNGSFRLFDRNNKVHSCLEHDEL